MTKKVARSSHLLLLVERHQELRSLITSKLKEEGFRVQSLAMLEKASLGANAPIKDLSLLILDTFNQALTLSALEGLPLGLPLLILSDHLDRGGPLLSSRPQTIMLQKPFTIRELVDAAHKICYKLL